MGWLFSLQAAIFGLCPYPPLFCNKHSITTARTRTTTKGSSCIRKLRRSDPNLVLVDTPYEKFSRIHLRPGLQRVHRLRMPSRCTFVSRYSIHTCSQAPCPDQRNRQDCTKLRPWPSTPRHSMHNPRCTRASDQNRGTGTYTATCTEEEPPTRSWAQQQVAEPERDGPDRPCPCRRRQDKCIQVYCICQ